MAEISRKDAKDKINRLYDEYQEASVGHAKCNIENMDVLVEMIKTLSDALLQED